MPTLQVENRSIYYFDQQSELSSLTFLLIHGAGSSHSVWQPAFFDIPELRVVAIDLPGHGQSDPPGRRTIEHYAGMIEQFAASLGLTNIVLGGHSMGSAIALMLAYRGIIDIDGLILIGASARMPVGDAIFGGVLGDPGIIGEFLANQTMIDAPDAYRQLVSQQLLSTGGMTTSGDFLACNRFDLRHKLATVDAPALVIAGRLDPMVPLRFSESLVRDLPHSRLVVLENTGHYAMLERPQEVRELAISFLSSR